MRSYLACTVVCLLVAAALAKPAPGKKDYLDRHSAVAEQGTTVPPSVPLNARLIANETIYYLDRGGLSETNYRKKLELAMKMGRLAAAPRVDLVFELENKGKEEIQVIVGGDIAGSLRWHLRGPGAVGMTCQRDAQSDLLKEPTAVRIPAGGSHRWLVKDLDGSGPRDTTRAYWTQTGDYLLSAGFTVAVRPVPKGTVPHWYHKDHGNVAITSGAVRITVLE
jgi:hypothetical protein